VSTRAGEMQHMGSPRAKYQMTNSRVEVDVVDEEGSCGDCAAAASEELQPSELVASMRRQRSLLVNNICIVDNDADTASILLQQAAALIVRRTARLHLAWGTHPLGMPDASHAQCHSPVLVDERSRLEDAVRIKAVT